MITSEQVVVVFAGVRGFLDKMVTSEISKFEAKFLDHIRSNHPGLLKRIKDTGALSKQDEQELSSILETFIPESGLQMKA